MAGYQDYASRLGGGQYEKVWDLGELPTHLQSFYKTHTSGHLCGRQPLYLISCAAASAWEAAGECTDAVPLTSQNSGCHIYGWLTLVWCECRG